MAVEQPAQAATGNLPLLLLGSAGLLVLLTHAVGWYSVEIDVTRWNFDDSAFENKGAPQPRIVFDLEMKPLQLETTAKPTVFENQIQARGAPTYADDAGNLGTLLLGVFMLQLTSAVLLAALIAFVVLDRKADQALPARRLGALFLLLGLFTMGNFAFSVGGAANDDLEGLLLTHRFTDQAAYDISDLEVGFWTTWQTDSAQTVQITPQLSEVWEIEARSRPSAGFFLQLGALALGAAALVVHARQPRPQVGGVSAESPIDAGP